VDALALHELALLAELGELCSICGRRRHHHRGSCTPDWQYDVVGEFSFSASSVMALPTNLKTMVCREPLDVRRPRQDGAPFSDRLRAMAFGSEIRGSVHCPILQKKITGIVTCLRAAAAFFGSLR